MLVQGATQSHKGLYRLLEPAALTKELRLTRHGLGNLILTLPVPRPSTEILKQ